MALSQRGLPKQANPFNFLSSSLERGKMSGTKRPAAPVGLRNFLAMECTMWRLGWEKWEPEENMAV